VIITASSNANRRGKIVVVGILFASFGHRRRRQGLVATVAA
jgi:hypothetical protein